MRRLNRYDDLLALHHNHPEKYPFLLESVAHGTAQSQFDILFCFPEEQLVLNQDSLLTLDNNPLENNDFLLMLDQLWQQNKVTTKAEIKLPFYGGWFTYLGYELAAHIEPTLRCYKDSVLPVAFASRIRSAVIRDHAQSCLYLVSNDEEKIHQMIADLDSCNAIDASEIVFHHIEEDNTQQFINGVERIKHYIYEGDVFQVNLSRGWKARSNESFSSVALYQRLRQSNPAPFSALVNYDNKTIISSSPERLVQTEGRYVQTRPIAGTRPRSTSNQIDQQLAAELMENVKERAEHIMLIDLERNDLGRVCCPGSIEVDALMVRESYAHVHHIVSNIRGQLRDNVTPGEVIRAVFPGGTITGCPKVRCMEIIHELEHEARGAYTGSVGYINDNGDMDLNILIRTLVCDGTTVQFRAGGGIVADSIAQREVAETRSKAKGLLLALQSV
ncbi:MAG: aminodeoxychorismate synthase component I [Gammaproteobacteria bacterium]|nr:aminodeoxychorismate synthase component I [Gammaproteobacteria bacterium]